MPHIVVQILIGWIGVSLRAARPGRNKRHAPRIKQECTRSGPSAEPISGFGGVERETMPDSVACDVHGREPMNDAGTAIGEVEGRNRLGGGFRFQSGIPAPTPGR
jgi:hypothetical protein